MKNIVKLISTLALAAIAIPTVGLVDGSTADAATATSNMDVSATVASECTISAGALAFGAYDGVVANLTTDLAGTATITVACTSGSTAVITLGQGANAAGGSTAAAPARQMVSGANILNYALTQTAGINGTVWGDTAGTGEGYLGVGTQEQVTVFGTIPAGQNVPTGSYGDTVLATITF